MESKLPASKRLAFLCTVLKQLAKSMGSEAADDEAAIWTPTLAERARFARYMSGHLRELVEDYE